MKTKDKSWHDIDKEIKTAFDEFNKYLTIEDLCQKYHKTRSIDAACTLADLLYDILYN